MDINTESNTATSTKLYIIIIKHKEEHITRTPISPTDKYSNNANNRAPTNN